MWNAHILFIVTHDLNICQRTDSKVGQEKA